MHEVKERITNLLRFTEREGIEDLIQWMNENGFFDAPCSSKYHLSKPGGLAEHSLNVFRTAFSLLESFYLKPGNKFTYDFIDSIIICTLLHDIGKAGQYGKPNYCTGAEMHSGEGFAGHFTYETNKDLLYVPHEIRSIAIISKFIQLTEEEQFAIIYHNGLYSELKSIKGNETPLYMILHFADLWAARVIEE